MGYAVLCRQVLNVGAEDFEVPAPKREGKNIEFSPLYAARC